MNLEIETLWKQMKAHGAGVHCLTNFVTAADVANMLLEAGASAIMAQEPGEMAEITEITQATLLNTGTPEDAKWEACILAGKRANELGHPVVLDPVGVGASRYRREGMKRLLGNVHPQVIRCNQEEAKALLGEKVSASAGVESSICEPLEDAMDLVRRLAQKYACTVYMSGREDLISDGSRIMSVCGGDARVSRLTGGGCMLSALCAALCAWGPAFDAALSAGVMWKTAALLAGEQTDRNGAGMGSYRCCLHDQVSLLQGEEWKGRIIIEDRS